jgi:hypothetical protein
MFVNFNHMPYWPKNDICEEKKREEEFFKKEGGAKT